MSKLSCYVYAKTHARSALQCLHVWSSNVNAFPIQADPAWGSGLLYATHQTICVNKFWQVFKSANKQNGNQTNK